MFSNKSALMSGGALPNGVVCLGLEPNSICIFPKRSDVFCQNFMTVPGKNCWIDWPCLREALLGRWESASFLYYPLIYDVPVRTLATLSCSICTCMCILCRHSFVLELNLFVHSRIHLLRACLRLLRYFAMPKYM